MKSVTFNKSKKLRNEYDKVLAGASTFSKVEYFKEENVPFCLTHCKGAYAYDADGNKYIDYALSQGAITLGHRNPKVTKAIREQLNKGTSFSLPTELEIDVSKMLIKMIPSAEKVRFGKNGNDATTAAVRLARYHTGKKHILFCGYHAWQDWYIGQTSMNGGVPDEVSKLSHRFVYNEIDTVNRLLKDLKNDVACIIIDPLPGQESTPNIKFLKELRKITEEKNIVLIFDEVVTGFRYIKGSVQSFTGITPDLSTFAKGLSNGMPLSAIVGKRKLMDKFPKIFFSLTYAGETLSLAAAKAVLTIYKNFDVPNFFETQGKKLKDGLSKLINDFDLQERMNVYGANCRFGVNFNKENIVKYDSTEDMKHWITLTSRHGILNSGMHLLSLAHNDDIISETLKKYKRLMPELRKILLN